jgi:hypothetical protein
MTTTVAGIDQVGIVVSDMGSYQGAGRSYHRALQLEPENSRRPEESINTSFREELEKTGFIKSVWR